MTGNHRTTARQFHRLTLLCLVCLLTLAVVASMLYIQVILNRNHIYVERIIDQYRGSIESCARTGIQFVQTLAYDSAISQYLIEEDPGRRYALGQQAGTFLSSMKAIQPQILDAFLFCKNTPESAFLALQPNQAQIMERISGFRLPVVAGFFPYRTATGESTALYVGCDIYNTEDIRAIGKPIGSVAVAISLDEMDADLEELSQIPGVYYAVLNEDASLIRGTTRYLDDGLLARAYALRTDGGEGTVIRFMREATIAPVLGTHGSLLVYTRPTVVLGDMFRASGIVLGLTAAMYLLLALVFRASQRSLAGPLSRLTHDLARGSREFTLEGNDDVRSLIAALNHLFSSEKYLSDTLHTANARLRESELTQARLELQFLRSQINPHFIYNALEIIRSMAIVHKTPEVGEISKSLAAILRYSIKGGETVTLRDELDIIACYLSIQTIRFGNRFTYHFDLEDGVETVMIPRMCLQPLVENAVTHGLEDKLSEGHLWLTAFIRDGELNISVEDDGVGLAPERVKALNDLLKQPEASGAAEGVGLVNVARRIQIARGNAFGMSLESELGRGTRVSLKLPISKEE